MKNKNKKEKEKQNFTKTKLVGYLYSNIVLIFLVIIRIPLQMS